jgi:hypothetical protein
MDFAFPSFSIIYSILSTFLSHMIFACNDCVSCMIISCFTDSLHIYLSTFRFPIYKYSFSLLILFRYLFLGNKCVGGSVLSPQGFVVHDSHAEQLARRGFIRFVKDENLFKIFRNMKFFFKDIYMDKLSVFKTITNQYLKKPMRKI